MNKDIAGGLGWAGGLLALAFSANFARKLGYIDGDAVTRLIPCASGLMVAWYGNRMPKKIVPSVCVRVASRVGGWAMVLSGLVYTGLWAFAPIPVATAAGTAAILAGMAVTIGYCLTLRARAKAA